MATKVGDIVSRIRADLTQTNVDSNLWNRHIWDAFYRNAQIILQREFDSNKLTQTPGILKTFNVNTEKFDVFKDTCVPLACVKCRIKWPQLLSGKSGPVVAFVGSPDMGTKVNVVSVEGFEIKTKIKSMGEMFGYLADGYLYLSSCLPCIQVRGVPDLSVDALSDSCDAMQEEVTIPDYLVETIIPLTKQSIYTALQVTQDTTANKTTTS